VVARDALKTVLGFSNVSRRLTRIVVVITEEKVHSDSTHFVTLPGNLELLAGNLYGLDGAARNLSDTDAPGIPVWQVDLDGFRPRVFHQR
jgi:hypothetical protein